MTPEVVWAQRSSDDEEDKCFISLTIRVPDLESHNVKFDENKLHFDGKTKQGAEYQLDLEFFKGVKSEEVKQTLTGNALKLHIPKAEKGLEYWPRLTKEKVKLPYLKTDFTEWVDEDDQDDAPDEAPSGMGGGGGMPDMSSMMGGMPGMPGMGGMGGLDFSKLGGMAGMGDMGDMGAGGEGADSDDDDDLPDLEEEGAEEKGTEEPVESKE